MVCHLLGVDLANVSVRRDSWKTSSKPGEDPGRWLNSFNQEWVDAASRLSPAILTELVALAGQSYIDYVTTLDWEAEGGPVGWATGDKPAPVWFDMAREYMERFVHQYQLREATGRPPLDARFMRPALSTAAHALPRALDGVRRSPGTSVHFVVVGEAGGTWCVTQSEDGWELAPDPAGPPACQVRTSTDGALKLYVRDPTAPPLDCQGDRDLGVAIGRVKAILG